MQVIVDKFRKCVEFLAIYERSPLDKLEKLYIEDVVRLYDIPVSIVSDIDQTFTPRFWNSFQQQMGIKLSLSTAFYPQEDGQSKDRIQTLEDILRARVLELKKVGRNIPIIAAIK